MRHKTTILILLWGILSASSDEIYATTNGERLNILKAFTQKGILYDDSVSIDSVIEWSERLLPPLEPTEKGDEMYFLLQLQLVNAYNLRGDISLGINQAQTMYEEAQKMDYKFGLVVASQAIGNAYTTASQYDRALESYKDAFNELVLISPRHPYRTQLLLNISNALQQKGNMEAARKILEEIKKDLQYKTDYATSFFAAIEEANYAISQGHHSNTYLEEAAHYLQDMHAIYSQHREKYYFFLLRYTTASYYLAMGYQDRSYWDKSAEIYEQLRKEYSIYKQSTFYRWGSMGHIHLYEIQGRLMEACLLYQELYPFIDALASESYTRQINNLRAKYKVNQMEIANKEEHNKIIASILAGSILLLILFFIIAVILKRQREKTALSTRRLELLRTRAENATAAKSIFLSNMSHEIRTPLNALSGFSSLLTEEGLDNETRHQCNEVILQNSELLLKLINDVIDLSSLEFGKIQFSIARHDVVGICRNVVETVSKVKQTQAEIRFATELKSMEIETDDSRLQQVLINLLINATKFTPQGSITLELKKESDECLLFSVADTGCGIPKDKQPTIFQRFEKLNENAQGSGLGLSICQLIIEHIGGKIWIDADYEGGSRFFFTHPVHQTHATAERKEDEA